ncbi:MAG: transaldolase family protein [Patescibacteria group bacterium]
MPVNKSLNYSKFNRALFLDSSKLEEVKKWNETGVVDGVTTNQLIMLKDGIKPQDYEKVIKAICREMKGKPVSIELTDSTATADEMIRQAKKLNNLADNIVVKVPLIPDTTKSLYVINQLTKLNIAVNITTIMTFEQMIMATLAVRNSKKLCFISLFWGRSMEDQVKYRSRFDYMVAHPRVGLDSKVNGSVDYIATATAKFLKEGGYDNVKIIVGSIRNAVMVGDAYAAGSNIVTITPEILMSMLFSQRTIETIQQFDEAWKEMQKKK